MLDDDRESHIPSTSPVRIDFELTATIFLFKHFVKLDISGDAVPEAHGVLRRVIEGIDDERLVCNIPELGAGISSISVEFVSPSCSGFKGASISGPSMSSSGLSIGLVVVSLFFIPFLSLTVSSALDFPVGVPISDSSFALVLNSAVFVVAPWDTTAKFDTELEAGTKSEADAEPEAEVDTIPEMNADDKIKADSVILVTL